MTRAETLQWAAEQIDRWRQSAVRDFETAAQFEEGAQERVRAVIAEICITAAERYKAQAHRTLHRAAALQSLLDLVTQEAEPCR